MNFKEILRGELIGFLTDNELGKNVLLRLVVKHLEGLIALRKLPCSEKDIHDTIQELSRNLQAVTDWMTSFNG